MKKCFRSVVLAWGIAAGVAPAGAHHAYDANYVEERGSIEGVVVEVFWGNPHVHYYLEVVGADGATRTWDVEAENLGVMGRAGWTSETLQLGDRVRVSGRLGREGRPRLALELESLEFLR